MQSFAPPSTRTIPGVYSTPEDEYRVLNSGVGLVDRSGVGRLVAAGEDALDLLDRLSTNQLASIEAGSGAPTVLTTNKGRVIDLLHVYRDRDHLIVTTSASNQQRVAEWIEFYTFVEDVTVQDVTDVTAVLSIVGPESPRILDGFTNGAASSLMPFEWRTATIDGASVSVYRTDFLGVTSFDLVADAEDANRLSTRLLDVGAVPVGLDAVEVVRIEQGVPAFGKELTEDYNPHEANLVPYICFSKGCYVGQEVITRLHTYKKVQKRLVGLRWDGEGVSAGAGLVCQGRQVGVVTSVAPVPGSGAYVGLGYVRREFAKEGMVVSSKEGVEDEIGIVTLS